MGLSLMAWQLIKSIVLPSSRLPMIVKKVAPMFVVLMYFT
jgi:hypothetical protein